MRNCWSQLSKIACTLQGKLFGLSAHARIGVRKKILGYCTILGGCGQPEHLSKKEGEGFLPKCLDWNRCLTINSRETFLETVPGAVENCIKTASSTQLINGTLVGAAPSFSS